MDERRDLRASDGDRHAAVERLRAAHDEGRLDLHEYDARVQRAYQSVTYGDLADLFVDLPVTLRSGAVGPPAASTPTPAAAAAPRPVRTGFVGAVSEMPTALKVLWTIWLSVVFINLTVWLLISLGNGFEENFWPMWFAVPGAALFGVTVGVSAIGRSRRAARLAQAARKRR